MLRRIGIWALCGLVVALLWALIFWTLGPARSGGLSRSFVLPLTIPIALLGRHLHLAITWYMSAVLNACAYALVGLAVETVRLMLAALRRRPLTGPTHIKFPVI